MTGDARDTGLRAASFGLVHARALLVTMPAPEQVVAEMARLARPGGWVAGMEPDVEHSLCYPPPAAWDQLREIFRVAFARSGAGPCMGRRLPELFRAAGLERVEAAVHAASYPVGHSRRTLIPDLVRSLRPVILAAGLIGESELAELDRAVRQHLADPRTLMMPHLTVAAWGRKPAGRPLVSAAPGLAG
jgi:SAM-dependent methyltransferase